MFNDTSNRLSPTNTRHESPELETGFVSSEHGHRLYYELNRSTAQSPSFVFVNNFFMTARQWRPFTEELRTKFSVLTYDLHGQGQSSPSEQVVSIARHAADVDELIRALDRRKVVLVGTCISSVIAAEFALRFGEALSGLVLVGCVVNPFGEHFHRLLHRSFLNSLRLGGPETLFDHYYPLLYTASSIQAGGAPGYLVAKTRFVQNNTQRQLELNLESSARLDFPAERLRAIRTPTLLLSGFDDFMTRPSATELLAKSMPFARACVMPNAGHNVYIEAPQAFQHHLETFATALPG